MTAKLLDGELLSARIRADVAERVARLRGAGVVVGLGTVLVGDDGPSSRYVEMKHADCAEVGIQSVHEHLPADASQAQLDEVVARFNADPAVHAFLVQLPLPAGLDEERTLLEVDPDKDVDGLHPINLGRLVMGVPGPLACTPAGIVELLAANEVPVEGKHVVVIGRGLTIGRPLALLLALKRPGCNAAVTVVHTGVEDLAGLVRQGDVVVSAAGRAGLVTPDMVKPGAAVVGAGTSWDGKKLLSDVDEGVAEVAGWITPRIGGVGPMTRAMLLTNAVRAGGARDLNQFGGGHLGNDHQGGSAPRGPRSVTPRRTRTGSRSHDGPRHRGDRSDARTELGPSSDPTRPETPVGVASACTTTSPNHDTTHRGDTPDPGGRKRRSS